MSVVTRHAGSKDPAYIGVAQRKGVGRVFRPGTPRELCRRALRLLARLLGELSDQNAYARHLAAHGRVHSAAEWRRFSDARHKTKFAQGRCC